MGRIVSELGLRYRPSNAADLEAHAHALRLLAEDVSDVPPDYLERAAKEWARKSPYLPKASDLIGLAQGYVSSASTGRTIIVNDQPVPTDIHEYCAWLNAKPCFAGQWSVKMQPSGKLGIERGRLEA